MKSQFKNPRTLKVLLLVALAANMTYEPIMSLYEGAEIAANAVLHDEASEAHSIDLAQTAEIVGRTDDRARPAPAAPAAAPRAQQHSPGTQTVAPAAAAPAAPQRVQVTVAAQTVPAPAPAPAPAQPAEIPRLRLDVPFCDKNPMQVVVYEVVEGGETKTALVPQPVIANSRLTVPSGLKVNRRMSEVVEGEGNARKLAGFAEAALRSLFSQGNAAADCFKEQQTAQRSGERPARETRESREAREPRETDRAKIEEGVKDCRLTRSGDRLRGAERIECNMKRVEDFDVDDGRDRAASTREIERIIGLIRGDLRTMLLSTNEETAREGQDLLKEATNLISRLTRSHGMAPDRIARLVREFNALKDGAQVHRQALARTEELNAMRSQLTDAISTRNSIMANPDPTNPWQAMQLYESFQAINGMQARGQQMMLGLQQSALQLRGRGLSPEDQTAFLSPWESFQTQFREMNGLITAPPTTAAGMALMRRMQVGAAMGRPNALSGSRFYEPGMGQTFGRGINTNLNFVPPSNMINYRQNMSRMTHVHGGRQNFATPLRPSVGNMGAYGLNTPLNAMTPTSRW